MYVCMYVYIYIHIQVPIKDYGIQFDKPPLMLILTQE